MNLDTLRKMLANEELQGLANGTMQVRQKNDPWDDGSQYAFNGDYESYEFRPTPQPPKKVLRPWTADELWGHRDCWFREIGFERMQRIVEINLDGPLAHIAADDVTAVTLLCRYEWFDFDGEWKPCGVEVEQTEGGE